MITKERNGLRILMSDKWALKEYGKANNDYTWYKTNVIQANKEKQINNEVGITGNQSQLNEFYNSNTIERIRYNSIFESPDSPELKSIQTIFTHGGELFMEDNPDLDSVDVQQMPTKATVKSEVMRYRTGTVEELWDVDHDADLNGIEMDDERIQIDLEVEYDGDTFEITVDYPFYSNPSSNTKFGQYIQRWGKPEVGQEVTVDFDEDGEYEVVGTGN